MKLKDLREFKEVIACGVLLAIGAYLNNPILLILAIIVGGYKQTKDGIMDTIENKHLNVELLMILSAIGACLIGYYMEGAVLIFIFSLSGALEALTLDRSQREIRSLMELQPTEATRILENGTTEVVDINDLHLDDHIIVAVGEIIPIDATILVGKSSIEEAAITGESMPTTKTVGDVVFGGTLNISQPLTLTVTSAVGDTLIQKIVRMVEEAQNYPSKTARFIDRLEDYYARVVLILVAVVIVVPIVFFKEPFESAFYRGMILLVVASPCALIASVTPATLSAISNGAKKGILVKGGIHFENLMDTKAIAFDKTGTLTQGMPSISDAYYCDDEAEIIKAVIAIEQFSTHPLASAIVNDLNRATAGIDAPRAIDIEEKPGYGVEGVYNDTHYRIGKYDYMTSEHQEIYALSQQWAKEGKSVVFIERNHALVGVLGLIDKVRPESKPLIAWFNEHQIETIMITGDVHETAQHIADEIGIARVISQALPDQKANIVRDLEKEYGTVVMVGDGINDAPALANATIGIAMGGGTDIAMEAADVILVKDNIENIRYAVELSKRLRKIVVENIIFSFSVIAILVISNFFNGITLPFGVVGHEGSTILVILNSLRLLKPLNK
ncbi:cadmium-translocating P-type ATPase [Erysipelothrix sp. HDW6C]|uniref:heavy metal translocating P-type ATPase n=1 Tax=Erysipelothrix sp. HDW6C TaxID=2714930 RepID=UPI00140BE80B|nr:heavy metal translocating P-type ATPase [Erysipelothrix sp. HDW6C]QIK69232.1 cadmium-translocating P-type ATPase [Erysipelothrix sp. HDW6C]